MQSRAIDKRRVRVLLKTTLIVVIACFTGSARADASGARTSPHTAFMEHIQRERVEAARISAAELCVDLRTDHGHGGR